MYRAMLNRYWCFDSKSKLCEIKNLEIAHIKSKYLSAESFPGMSATQWTGN